MLTQERLKQVLTYDPEMGIFRWLVAPNGRITVGMIAGSEDKDENGRTSYINIKIDRKLYRAHRLSFFYMTGRWPEPECDHRDLNGINNRWSNLREATTNQNAANRRTHADNRSGVKGVSFHKASGKYCAKITVDGKETWLGLSPTKEGAAALYAVAAHKHHGEFARLA